MNQDRRGEIRELEKDPEMLEMESRMSQRNRHREQTLSGRDGDTKESNRERRILGEGLGDREGRETVIGVGNEWSRQKQKGPESRSVLPHALVIFQKYYNQAAFVFILKKKRKMAKERGLISPSDFAQLQKYMECESLLSVIESWRPYPYTIPPPHSPQPLLFSLVALRLDALEICLTGRRRGGKWGDIWGLSFLLTISKS